MLLFISNEFFHVATYPNIPIFCSFLFLPPFSPPSRLFQPSAVLISSTGGESGDEEEEGEEEEVCVVGSVEYYVDFCLDWRGIPVREVGGGVDGGKRIEWKPNEETAVLYPAAPLQLPIHNSI